MNFNEKDIIMKENLVNLNHIANLNQLNLWYHAQIQNILKLTLLNNRKFQKQMKTLKKKKINSINSLFNYIKVNNRI